MKNEIIKVIDLIPGESFGIKTISASEINEEIFWSQFVKKCTPLLIKGGASKWPAVTKWNDIQYLKSKCEDERAVMLRTFNHSPQTIGFERADFHKKIVDFFDDISTSNENEVLSMPSFPIPEKWYNDIGDLKLLINNHRKKPFGYPDKRVFLYKNASTEWHFHAVDETLTSQIVGSKRFSLFRLGSKSWNRYSPLIQANLHHLACSEKIFPADTRIEKHEAILEPGDVIYIPPFWWHGVDPVGSQMGVTVAECFRSPLTRIGSWKEPAIKEMSKHLKPLQLLQLNSLVALSTIKRCLHQENWTNSDADI